MNIQKLAPLVDDLLDTYGAKKVQALNPREMIWAVPVSEEDMNLYKDDYSFGESIEMRVVHGTECDVPYGGRIFAVTRGSNCPAFDVLDAGEEERREWAEIMGR